MLNVLDAFAHECLAIRVARKLKAIDVIDVLSDLCILQSIPAHIRSDNGPEFVAKAFQEWIAVSVPRPPTSSAAAPGRTATSRTSTPAFAMSRSTARSSTLARGLDRHRELATPLQHDQAHASIGYKPPAPEVFVPAFAAWPAALRRPAPPVTLAQRPTLN
jgi:putative transposase